MYLSAEPKLLVATEAALAAAKTTFLVFLKVKKVAGWKSTLFSGEGLVVELEAPGKVTLQSRSQDAFLSWLIPRIPKQTTYGSSGS